MACLLRAASTSPRASRLLDHPGTVYLREVDLPPHLDGWLTGLFETPAEPSKLWAPSGLFPTAEDRARQDEQRGAEPARRVRGVRG